MPLLNLQTSIVAYDDAPSYSNPRRMRPNWQRANLGVPVASPGVKEYVLEPGEEQTLFSGVRTLTADAATDYDLANVPLLGSSYYRLAWGGAGVTPGFRTARAVALAGGNLVLTLQANSTVIVTSSLGAVFGAVVAGDAVFVPGASTGDSGSFDPLNVGYWTVLAAGAAQLTLGRGTGVFSGATETVAIAADAEFQAFSAAGVQPGDTVDVSAGFAPAALRAYVVQRVTATRLEFASASPLAAETAVPGVAGLIAYSQAKRFVCVEADQEVALKYNGDTGEGCRVTPWVPADADQVGFDMKVGVVWALAVKNRSAAVANVLLITAA